MMNSYLKYEFLKKKKDKLKEGFLDNENDNAREQQQ